MDAGATRTPRNVPRKSYFGQLGVNVPLKAEFW